MFRREGHPPKRGRVHLSSVCLATRERTVARRATVQKEGKRVVARYEIDHGQTITLLDVRHQREEDYH